MGIRRLAGATTLLLLVSLSIIGSPVRAQTVPHPVPVDAWAFLADEAVAVLAAQGFPADLTPDFARSAIRAYTFARLIEIIGKPSEDRSADENAAYGSLQSAVRSSRLAISRNAVTYWDNLRDGDPCWSGGNPDSGVFIPPDFFVSLLCAAFGEDKPNQREVYRGQGAAETYRLLLTGSGAAQILDLLEAMDWYAARAETDGGTLFQGDSEAEQSYQAVMDVFRFIRGEEKVAAALSLVTRMHPLLVFDPEIIIRVILVVGTTIWDTADFTVIGNDLRAERDAAQSANPNLEAILDGPLTELVLVFMGTVLYPAAIGTAPCGFNSTHNCEHWRLRENDPDYTLERYDSVPTPSPDPDSYFALKRHEESAWTASTDLSPHSLTGAGLELWAVPVSGSSQMNGELGGSSTRLQDPLPAGVTDPGRLRVSAGVGLSSFVSDGFLVHSPVAPDGERIEDLWKFGTTIKYKNWAGEWWKALFVNDTFLHVRVGYELPGLAQVAGFVQNDGGLIIQDGTYTDGYTYCKAWTRFAVEGYSTRDHFTVDGQCILLSRDFDHTQLAVGDRISIGGRTRTIKQKVNCEGVDLNNTGPLIDLFVGQLWCDDDSTNSNYSLPAETMNWGRTALIVDPPLQSLAPGGAYGTSAPSPWLTVQKLEELDTCARATTGVPWFSCGPVFNPQTYNPRDFDHCPRFGEPIDGDSSQAAGYREFVFEDDVWQNEFAPMGCFYSPMVRYRDAGGNNWSGLFLVRATASDDAYTISGPSRAVRYEDGVVMNDNIPSSASITDKSGYVVSLIQDVTHGSLQLNPDGSFLYTRGRASADNFCGPSGEPYCGPDSFEYQVCATRDGRADCDTARVDLTVANEPPRVFDVNFEFIEGDNEGTYVASYVYWDPEGDPESGTTIEWNVRNSWGEEFIISTLSNVLPADTVIPGTSNGIITEVMRVSIKPSAGRGSWPRTAGAFSSDDNWAKEYGIRIQCDPEFLSPEGGSSSCVFSPWINRPYTIEKPYWLELGTLNLAYRFTAETCVFDHIVGFNDIGSQTCRATLERNPDFNDSGVSVQATASIWLNGGFGVGERVHTSGKLFGRSPLTAAHTITPIANPGQGGTVSCPEQVVAGADALCTALPNAGWQFVGWAEDCIGVNALCKLHSVSSPRTVIAHFLPRVSGLASPEDGGFVTCTGNPVPLAGSITCSATSAPGFAFAAWGGDCTGLDPLCTLSGVTGPLVVSANFIEVFPSADGVTRSGGVPWVQVMDSDEVGGSNGWTSTSRDDEINPTLGWIPLTDSPNSPEILPPEGVELIYGLLDITLTGGVVGSTAQVRITYPDPLPPGTQYWKYNRNLKEWYPLAPSAYIVDGNVITLSLTDGGHGDHDGAANGTIVDPGGPAILVLDSGPPVPDPEPPVPDPEPPVPDPEPPVIDDGVVFCAIGCQEATSDNGARTVLFVTEDLETGTQVRLEAVLPDADGNPLRHRVHRTLSDGTETLTEAVSELPGSTVTLERDEHGRVRIVTRAMLGDGVLLEVLARADGSAEHRVSTQAGETVAGTDVPGAFTRFTEEGRVATFLEFASGQDRFRAVAWTENDGGGHTGFERWDDLAVEWVLASRTIDDTVSRFETGHRVWIAPVDEDGLRFEVETQVTRDLYF